MPNKPELFPVDNCFTDHSSYALISELWIIIIIFDLGKWTLIFKEALVNDINFSWGTWMVLWFIDFLMGWKTNLTSVEFDLWKWIDETNSTKQLVKRYNDSVKKKWTWKGNIFIVIITFTTEKKLKTLNVYQAHKPQFLIKNNVVIYVINIINC